MTKQEAFKLVPDDSAAKQKAEMTFKEQRLASAIGKAVLDAVKEMQPETQPPVSVAMPEYQSKKQLAERYAKSTRTVENLISEIREQVEAGRYNDMAVLDGCGTMVNTLVFFDYLNHRKMLKDPVARKYVAPYDAMEVRKELLG